MLKLFTKNFILLVNGVLSMIVVWISNFVVKAYIASDSNSQLLVINFILGILFLLTFIISGFDENYIFDRHLIIKLISCLLFYTGGYISVVITRYSGFHFQTTFNFTISKIGWYEIIIILIFMVWILIDVSFEYEEKFDIDQESFQNFSESINFNHHSPTESFDTHSSDEYFSDSQSSDVHDASRDLANFFVKRKIVRIRVESRAKFLGRKIEFSNFELSQPSFSSRYNQDRQIMQINASSDNMDVNSKEFIDVVNTTNSQETGIIPSAELVHDVPLDQCQLNLFRFRHRKILKDSIIGVN